MQDIHYKKILILSALLLIFSVCVFLFIYNGINANDKTAVQVLSQWQTEASRREGIKILNDSIQTIEDEKTSLETHFAQSSDVVPFLDTIEGLASKTGTKAEIVSVEIAGDNSGLLVEMKISGSFESIYKSLLLLENSRRYSHAREFRQNIL